VVCMCAVSVGERTGEAAVQDRRRRAVVEGRDDRISGSERSADQDPRISCGDGGDRGAAEGARGSTGSGCRSARGRGRREAADRVLHECGCRWAWAERGNTAGACGGGSAAVHVALCVYQVGGAAAEPEREV